MLALAGGLADAGVVSFGATTKNVGASTTQLAVSAGDRVVGVLQATDPPVLGWFDTEDWRDDAVQTALDGLSDARAILAAGDADAPLFLVGGAEGVVVVSVDDSDSPAILTPEPIISLPSGDDAIDALAWDDARGVAYGANSTGDLLHWIPVTGASGAVDSESGWPLSLPFHPTHLATLDAEALLVAGEFEGEARLSVVELDGGTPSEVPLGIDGVTGPITGVGSDDGFGFAVTSGGDLIVVANLADGDDDDATGDDDDSAGDDDDSAGDDDDSAGDDDDSAGDDDDSAGDDDDSASARAPGDWGVQLLSTDEGAVDMIARDGVVYVAVADRLIVIDSTGTTTDTIDLDASPVALAAASSADGYLYATLDGSESVAILDDGPFLTITAADTAVAASGALDITLDADPSPGDGGSCTLSATIDGTIAGDGTAVSLDEDEVLLGATTTVSIPADSLESGTHRLHLFCGSGAEVGRASLTYYLGELEAPQGFTVSVGEGTAIASWTDNDDESVITYDLLFGTVAFEDGDDPGGTNADGTVTSPISVDAPTDSIGEATITHEVANLVNGTTYYFAVAAVDGDGTRGPYSTVVAATPNVTGGIAALSGDPGCTCAYAAREPGSGRAALLPLSFLLLALVRRRRPGVL